MMRTARALLVVSLLALVPAAQPASAFVCDPSVRDVCNAVCARATKVCSLFG